MQYIYLYLLKHWMHCLLFYTNVKQVFFSRFRKRYIKVHTLFKTCESQTRISSPARLTRITLPLNQLPWWKSKHKNIWSNQSYGFSSYVLQRYPKIWKFVVWILFDLFCAHVVNVTSAFNDSCIILISLDVDELWSLICFLTVKTSVHFQLR